MTSQQAWNLGVRHTLILRCLLLPNVSTSGTFTAGTFMIRELVGNKRPESDGLGCACDSTVFLNEMIRNTIRLSSDPYKILEEAGARRTCLCPSLALTSCFEAGRNLGLNRIPKCGQSFRHLGEPPQDRNSVALENSTRAWWRSILSLCCVLVVHGASTTEWHKASKPVSIDRAEGRDLCVLTSILELHHVPGSCCVPALPTPPASLRNSHHRN